MKAISIRAACLLAAMFSLQACGGGNTVEADVSPLAFEARELSPSSVPGNFYGDWAPGTFVARNDAQWTAIWNSHDSLQTPAPARPVVDFSVYSVVGVSQGWGPDGCHWLAIVRVTEEATQVRVEYDRGVNDGTMGCTAALVPMVAFAAIPATSKPVIFHQAGTPAVETAGQAIARPVTNQVTGLPAPLPAHAAHRLS